MPKHDETIIEQNRECIYGKFDDMPSTLFGGNFLAIVIHEGFRSIVINTILMDINQSIKKRKEYFLTNFQLKLDLVFIISYNNGMY